MYLILFSHDMGPYTRKRRSKEVAKLKSLSTGLNKDNRGKVTKRNEETKRR